MSFAVRSSAGEHLGFLLLDGEGASGHCIFRSLPPKAESFDAPASAVLYDLQQSGELSWHMEQKEMIIFSPDGSLVATLEDGRLIIGDQIFSVVKMGLG